MTPLVLIGSPMDASGFQTLASHFPDRVVVTYDPRNTGRSEHDEPTTEVTAEQHADDLHAVLQALGTGPVDLFASSGGAINALALVARHPEDVGLLVAHEPPLVDAVPDREAVASVIEDMWATYQAQRLRLGHGEIHLLRDVPRRGPRRVSGAACPGPGDVRHVR